MVYAHTCTPMCAPIPFTIDLMVLDNISLCLSGAVVLCLLKSTVRMLTCNDFQKSALPHVMDVLVAPHTCGLD